MSEPRIEVKVVGNRFVTCFQMPEQRPDEVTFPQSIVSTNTQKVIRHRHTASETLGMMDYVLAKVDAAA